jgi:hypothetical protein
MNNRKEIANHNMLFNTIMSHENDTKSQIYTTLQENMVSSSVLLYFSVLISRKIPGTDERRPLTDEYTWQYIHRLTDECLVPPPDEAQKFVPVHLLPPRVLGSQCPVPFSSLDLNRHHRRTCAVAGPLRAGPPPLVAQRRLYPAQRRLGPPPPGSTPPRAPSARLGATLGPRHPSPGRHHSSPGRCRPSPC